MPEDQASRRAAAPPERFAQPLEPTSIYDDPPRGPQGEKDLTKTVVAESLEKIDNEEREVDKRSGQGRPVASPEEKIKELFGALPEDARERLQAVRALYAVIRREAAETLQPTITSLLREIATMDYDQKAALAHQINSVLQDARLALLDPETRLPAKLLAHRPRPSSVVSSLRLRDTRKSPGGGGQHYLRVEDLEPGRREFELVDASPDVEPLRGRQDR